MRREGVFLWALALAFTLVGTACGPRPWNNPYPPEESGRNILYSSFQIRPKHLDPVRSYSSDEYAIIGQIYEPPLQYHYLKRPYELEPLTARAIPKPTYLDSEGRELPADAPEEAIAYSVYEIRIKPGIRYQPHPAFAKDAEGNPLYHDLTAKELADVNDLGDFPERGTRELVAADYVYQIKRMAHPRLHSPIYSLMAEYIVGLRDYAAKLKEVDEQQRRQQGREEPYLDLSQYPLAGVELVDRYTYRIKVRGKYPQLVYWLAMPFFAPVPPEVERFYSQPGMQELNINLDWYPVGTGAYMLTVNNPNRQMVLERNPNFHKDTYPIEGEPGDARAGLLDDAGEPLPFIEKIVYSLEKETIPYWNKFLQGYYDVSPISSDSFDQAIQFSVRGEAEVTPAMEKRDIQLLTTVEASTFYAGFNMLDPVVGGYSDRARKLRRAISIAVDYEEFVSIFRNGRGIPAQGPIPPGIFGYQEGREGINPYVYEWEDGGPRRRSIAEAKRLLAEAGYPNGRDAETGEPLLIYLDTSMTGPEAKPYLDWWRKQLAKIDVQLLIRNTDYNRFREKMRKGNAQLFLWGWNADYPDPENFFFLLYGPNGKVKHQGENAANYDNPEFNRLFEQMKTMHNGPERLRIIRQMLKIARRDAPWLWGYHPQQYVLHHDWYHNVKPNLMAHNYMKYRRIDPELREKRRQQWNQAEIWPIYLLLGAIIVLIVPAIVMYRRREKRPIGAQKEDAHS